MRLPAIAIILAAAAALSACKSQEAQIEARPVRTVMVQARPLEDAYRAVGEVRARYDSSLS